MYETGALYCLLTAAGIILLLWLPGIRIGLNTADEGYLCFGAQQYTRGKVPIRDFRAYDPGRYLWVGLFMKLFGKSFHIQRLAMSFVMIATLSIAGWLIFQVSNNWYTTVLTELLLYLWLQPYYKSFEILTCLLTIASGYLLLKSPGGQTLLYSGMIHGLAFFFGLNIGIYAGAAFFVLCLICFIFSELSFLFIVGIFSVGTAVGIVPLLYVIFRYRGFASVYWNEKIRAIFKRGTTNLSLPVPFFRNPAPHWDNLSQPKRIFYRTLFNSLPIIYLIGMISGLVLVDKNPPLSSLLISTSAVGVIYLHHLYARCDTSHLCQSVHPGLLVIIAISTLLFSTTSVLYILTFLIISSALASGENIKGILWYFSRNNPLKKLTINNEFFLLPHSQAELFERLNRIIDTYSIRDDKCFFAPLMPGFYALYNREPASYDTFCVYPSDREKQDRMIRQLNTSKAQLVIIYDVSLDGRDDLRFPRTHPLVWEAITQNFKPWTYEKIPDHIKIFIRH